MGSRQTWLIGDTHFDHTRMCEYCSRPENFNQLIISHWKKMIQPNDLVYHLGDVYFGKQSRFFGCIESLPGQKILIKGNHDREKTEWYLNHGFIAAVDLVVVTTRTKLKSGKIISRKILISHKPIIVPMLTFEILGIEANIHGHFHNNPLDKCEQDLVKILSKQHYLFSLEETNYKPVLLNRVIEDGLVVQGK